MYNEIENLLNEFFTKKDKYNAIGGKSKSDSKNDKKSEESDEIKKKKKTLKKLEKKIKDVGLSFWYDVNGKLIVRQKTHEEGYAKMKRLILKDIDKYADKNIIAFDVYLNPLNIGKKYKKKEDESGVVKFDIHVHKIVVVNYEKKLVSIEPRQPISTSNIRLFYRDDEIKKVKISHGKKIALALLKNKIKKINPFKFYHLEDFEDILNSDDSSDSDSSNRSK